MERGFSQQRLPPADGMQAGGSALMPESSRPSSFTINTELPVVSGKEQDTVKRAESGEEPPLLPPDVEAPSKGTEFQS